MAYNHVFAFCFSVSGSLDQNGEDVTAEQIRHSIQSRLNDLSDEELVQCCGVPKDTCEENQQDVKRVVEDVKKLGPFGAMADFRTMIRNSAESLGVTLTVSQEYQAAFELGNRRLLR